MVFLFGKKTTQNETSSGEEGRGNPRIIRTLKTDLIQLNLAQDDGIKNKNSTSQISTVPQPSFPEPREERPREKVQEKISPQGERLMINPFQETGLRTPTPPPAPKPPSPIKTIHTFTSDVAENIQKNKTSIVEIAQMEAARRRETEADGAVQKKSIVLNVLLIALGIVFLGGGGTAVYWFVQQTKEAPLMQTQTVSSELFKYEKTATAQIGTTKNNTESSFSKTLGEIGVNEIKRIVFTDAKNQPITSIEFMRGLDIEETDLFTSITNSYFLGAYKTASNKVFLVLQSKNPELSYLSLVKWEKDMLRDLQNLLLIPSRSRVIPPFFSNNQSGHQYVFEDGAIQSKDVRVARDERGQIVILYGFLDQEYLIITTDQDTFKEVFNRFTKARYIQ